MLNTSVAAQTLVPMAVSLAFGVLFSTVVTLFVVPAGFVIIDELIVGLKRFFANSSKALSSAD